jgi:transketolase
MGVSLGWERWAGDEGAIVALDHFGTSAPAGTILREFGFTADAVADVGRRVVRDGFRGRVAAPPSPHPGGTR